MTDEAKTAEKLKADKLKADNECDYLNVRLVLTESVVPEETELTVTPPFRSGDLVEFTIAERFSKSDDEDDATIMLNPKQVRALVLFLAGYMADDE